ncbi:hypothetical protein TKK_0011048 [Trichogramma kaykai]
MNSMSLILPFCLLFLVSIEYLHAQHRVRRSPNPYAYALAEAEPGLSKFTKTLCDKYLVKNISSTSEYCSGIAYNLADKARKACKTIKKVCFVFAGTDSGKTCEKYFKTIICPYLRVENSTETGAPESNDSKSESDKIVTVKEGDSLLSTKGSLQRDLYNGCEVGISVVTSKLNLTKSDFGTTKFCDSVQTVTKDLCKNFNKNLCGLAFSGKLHSYCVSGLSKMIC